MTILNKSATILLEQNFELLKSNFDCLDDFGKSLLILHECEIISTDEMLHYFSKIIEITGEFFSEHFLKIGLINTEGKNHLEYIIHNGSFLFI